MKNIEFARRLKKNMSLLLVLMLSLQCFGGLNVFASADLSVSVDGELEFDDARFPYKTTLIDNGDGTYTWEINVSAAADLEDTSLDRTMVKDGWFTAPIEGYYLIEAWGGNGGKGEDTSYSYGGAGGSGGYVYSKVYLNTNETLFYAIGGNGGTVTHSDLGGAGGGGTHGNDGWYEVGAGGGYTAIYKYGVGEFEAAYLDSAGTMTQSTISEVDRISRVIMIAGGGGGGGTGNGFALNAQLSSTGSKGGAGGDILTSNSGTIPGVGTYYIGSDGYSSGASTNYVGLGGSNIPGTGRYTAQQEYRSEDGKYWSDGGLGGDGNIRGGAGGAGYCGGSGGISKAFMYPYDIGGGGGASSFVSSTVSTNLTSYEQSLISGSVNPDYSNGGSVKISYTGADSDVLDYLSAVDFSGTSSAYFDITNAVLTGQGTITHTSSNFAVNDAILFDGNNCYGLKITLTLAPKSGFPGGNDVPIFNNDQIVCTATGQTNNIIITNNGTGYVNVPYQLKAVGNSVVYDTTVSPVTPVPGTSLYTADSIYTNTKNGAGSGLYYFIASVGNYKINNSTPAATYSPNASTQYSVSFDVVPRASTGKAEIGDVLTAKTMSAIATITVIKNTTGVLNGNTVDYTRYLTYSNGMYYLNTEFSSLVSRPAMSSTTYSNVASSTFNSSSSYTAPYTGYYYLQAWGGDGGDGGRDYNKHDDAKGSGADGGYAYGIVHLTQGQTIYATVGSAGSDGSDATSKRYDENGMATPGTGGDASAWQITSGTNSGAYIIIAGGGGGGGAAVNRGTSVSQTAYKAGDNAVANTTLTSSALGSISLSTYNGGNGEAGYYSGSITGTFRGGYAGASGANVQNTTVAITTYNGITSSSQSLISGAATTNSDATGRAVVIPLDYTSDVLSVNNYDQLTIDISQYWDIGAVTLTGVDTYSENINQSTKSISLSNIKAIGCGTYTDDLTPKTINFTVSVALTPISGFLGGNDVPVVDGQITLYQQDSNSNNSDDTLTLLQQNDADYANVAIPELLTLNTESATYVMGDSPIALSDVVTYSVPTANSVQKAFVNMTSTPDFTPSFNGSPRSDTTYLFELGIEPKAAPTKAVVVPEAEAVSIEKSATIFVKASLNYSLSHISADGFSGTKLALPLSEAYSTVLKPDTDYQLPDTITVTIDGVATNNYTYDAYTGQLDLPAAVMNGAVVVSATAIKPTKYYYIYYVYQTSPYDTSSPVTHSDRYQAEDTIVDWTQSYTPATYPGYSFVWETVPTTMPAENVYVIGGYVANQYTVTINYYKTGTTEVVATAHSEQLYYSENYSVVSPEIAGYTPDRVTVSGTVTGNETINVYYAKNAPGQLIISYIYDDTNAVAATPVNESIEVGESYSVPSPIITGYTASVSSISGTMTADGASYIVRYTPNEITVTLSTLGTVNPNTITVTYHNIYGYNGEDYVGLPRPTREGYRFLGWYLDNGYTTPITEESVVITASSHTLYAKWDEIHFTVTVKYIYEDGSIASADVSSSGMTGTSYTFSSPSVIGCTPDHAIVSGNYISTNQTLYVTYIGNLYTLTINYVDADTNQSMSGMSAYTQQVKYRSSYSVASPAVPSGYESVSESIVSGTMPAAPVAATVYYYKVIPVVSVSIEWGELTYEYSYDDWNPNTHSYDTKSFTTYTAGADEITIKNNQSANTKIDVSISYSSKPAYSSVIGSFNDGTNNINNVSNMTPGSSQTFYLALDGEMPSGTAGKTLTVGTTTVTIRGGNLVQ